MPSPAHLGIDFGTSHTVAVVRRADGRTESLLFDSSPLLPSAVFAGDDGDLLTGRDALHSARTAPARMEPHPKHRVDDGTVLLGEREYSVIDLFTVVLDRVGREGTQVLGAAADHVVMTHPATWGATRRSVLREACERAGFDNVRLVPEPVAAATYFVEHLDHRVPVGSSIVVYDFGGGTFDATVVTRDHNGFTVTALDGLDHLGGTDIDAAVTTHLKSRMGTVDDWAWLSAPQTPAERRGRHGFVEDVRLAKERLTRHTTADLYIPVLDRDVHLTRTELEELALPLVARSVDVVHKVIADAAVEPKDLAGVFLVGGASRMPLVATSLHRALGVAPVVVDQLEQVVAQGALLTGEEMNAAPASVAGAHVPAGVASASTSGEDVADAVTSVASEEDTATSAKEAVAAHELPTSEPEAEQRRSRLSRRTVLTGGLVGLALAAVPVALALSGDEATADPDGPTSPEPTWRPEVFVDGLVDVGAVAFSPDNDTVAIAVDGAVELVSMSGSTVRVLPHGGRCERLAFNADGARLTGCGAGSAFVWQVETGNMTCEFHNDVRAVAISPGGSRLAYDDDEQVVLWDIANSEVAQALAIDGGARSLAFNSDGTRLAVGWQGRPVGDFDFEQQVMVWDTSVWGEVAVLDYSGPVVGTVAFSPDGSTLAAGGGSGSDTSINLWNLDGWERETLDVEGDSANIAYSPDAGLLASGGNTEGTVETRGVWLWNAHTREYIDTLSHEDGHVRGVAFGPAGETIAAALESSVVMWRRV